MTLHYFGISKHSFETYLPIYDVFLEMYLLASWCMNMQVVFSEPFRDLQD